MKKLQMLIVTTGLILSITLTACTSPRSVEPESFATEIPRPALPNPASVYCEQQGNTLEIKTSADGSQSGVCIFPDGSSCDEWAYFRGECGDEVKTSSTRTPTAESTSNASGGYMQPGTSEPITDWWGIIKSSEPGAQYDDYFVRQDLGGEIYFGIDSKVSEVKSQIEALRNSGKIVHLYGTLLSHVLDYNGSQVLVERMVVDSSARS